MGDSFKKIHLIIFQSSISYKLSVLINKMRHINKKINSWKAYIAIYYFIMKQNFCLHELLVKYLPVHTNIAREPSSTKTLHLAGVLWLPV